MDKEMRADYAQAVTDGSMLDEMVKTAGWQTIILPTFTELRSAAVKKLLVEGETEQDLRKAKAAVEMIDKFISDPYRAIESDVDRRIREGKEAAKILSKEPEEQEE